MQKGYTFLLLSSLSFSRPLLFTQTLFVSFSMAFLDRERKLRSILSKVFSMADRIPIVMCVVCARAVEMIAKFPDLILEDVVPKRWAVASLLFLRYLCPAMTSHIGLNGVIKNRERSVLVMSKYLMRVCCRTRESHVEGTPSKSMTSPPYSQISSRVTPPLGHSSEGVLSNSVDDDLMAFCNKIFDKGSTISESVYLYEPDGIDLHSSAQGVCDNEDSSSSDYRSGDPRFGHVTRVTLLSILRRNFDEIARTLTDILSLSSSAADDPADVRSHDMLTELIQLIGETIGTE